MAITRPVNLQKPFADAGARRDIPVDSQIGIDNGAASFTDGFPPLTRTPIAAGGIPPKGIDMNGILFALSQHTVFQNAGGQYRFDAALAAEIGGYSIGTILQSNDGLASYLSIVDGNTDNFNADPASIGVSWLLTGMPRATTAQAQALASDAAALTPKKLDDTFKGANQDLSKSGFQRFPGGLMLQWLEGDFTMANPSVTNTLPVSFAAPMGDRSSLTICNHYDSASGQTPGTGPVVLSSYGESLSTVRVTRNTSGGAVSGKFTLYALGRWK